MNGNEYNKEHQPRLYSAACFNRYVLLEINRKQAKLPRYEQCIYSHN